MIVWRKFFSPRSAILLLIIVFEIIFFVGYNQLVRESTTSRVLEQQFIFTKAQASIAQSFFDIFDKAFVSFSKLSTLRDMDQETLADLEEFYNWSRKSGTIDELILTDENGKVIFSSDDINSEQPISDARDVSYEDYFIWAKAQSGEGAIFIDEPAIDYRGAKNSQVIIPIVSPVYSKDKFAGVIAASVELERIMTQYIGLLQPTSQTEVYLLSNNGIVLYSSNDSDVVGSRLSTIDGRTFSYMSDKDGGKVKTSESLITYSPLQLENQHWLLVLVTPTRMVMSLDPVLTRIRYIALMLLVMFTVVIYRATCGCNYLKSS